MNEISTMTARSEAGNDDRVRDAFYTIRDALVAGGFTVAEGAMACTLLTAGAFKGKPVAYVEACMATYELMSRSSRTH